MGKTGHSEAPHLQVGVLAFGSLIGDAGELDLVTAERVAVDTPFPVEFARTSSRRSGGPTLIRIADGGAHVAAKVLVLMTSVSMTSAADMLYRRETNQVGSGISYVRKENPSLNDVQIEQITNFGRCDLVLYTKIAANIEPLTAAHLAELAISSAKKSAGARRRDGISYLIEAKENGVVTQLSSAYEAEVLAQTNTENLAAAWRACRKSAESSERNGGEHGPAS